MYETKDILRTKISEMLGIPQNRCPLLPEFRGAFSHDGLVIERWIWTSEPHSRVTSLLYKPAQCEGKLPGVVIVNGHGGSKSSLYNLYTAQLYAKAGIACLLHDTIGEEERNVRGEKGTRAHDDFEADRIASQTGRLMMGKMVYDAMRAIDFLMSRPEVNSSKIGIAGNSLGGAVGEWLMALDPRVCAAIVSGFGVDTCIDGSKLCTNVPNQRLRTICSWEDFLALTIPQCAVLIMNGERDYVINKGKTPEFFDLIRRHVDHMNRRYEEKGLDPKAKAWFDSEGGHRAYHNHKDALLWFNKYIGTPCISKEEIERLPEITLGDWCALHGLTWQGPYANLYWNEESHRGAKYADLKITPVPTEDLRCLKDSEIGDPEYTLEGWLEVI